MEIYVIKKKKKSSNDFCPLTQRVIVSTWGSEGRTCRQRPLRDDTCPHPENPCSQSPRARHPEETTCTGTEGAPAREEAQNHWPFQKNNPLKENHQA